MKRKNIFLRKPNQKKEKSLFLKWNITDMLSYTSLCSKHFIDSLEIDKFSVCFFLLLGSFHCNKRTTTEHGFL